MTLPSREFSDFVTRLNEGDPKAREEILPLVLDELHRIAARFVPRDREVAEVEHDMLVDDVFMKLTKPEFKWNSAREFYYAAAETMRRLLNDSHRKIHSKKRGGAQTRRQIDIDALPSESPAFDYLELDDAIEAIRKTKPECAEVVDVHILLGETFETTAKVLGLTETTVRRRWEQARELLREQLLPLESSPLARIESPIALELTIEQDFDSFSTEDQLRLLASIQNLLGTADSIHVVQKRRGSTKITLELTREQAEQLLWLYERGVLTDQKVTNAKVIGNAAAAAILKDKAQSDEYDVFLCHNSEDKVEVKRIGLRLRQHGILPWLDEWELQPGLQWQDALEQQIETIKSAAVFVGDSGFGPWQNMELNAFIREFVRRRCPVIPVILGGCQTIPNLPPFLNGMTWVNFGKRKPNPYDQLIWGITGRKQA